MSASPVWRMSASHVWRMSARHVWRMSASHMWRISACHMWRMSASHVGGCLLVTCGGCLLVTCGLWSMCYRQGGASGSRIILSDLNFSKTKVKNRATFFLSKAVKNIGIVKNRS